MDYPQITLAEEDLQELQAAIAGHLNALIYAARSVNFRLLSFPADMKYVSFEADLQNIYFLPTEEGETREQCIHNWVYKIAETKRTTLSSIEIDYTRGVVAILIETGIEDLIQNKIAELDNQEDPL